MNNIAIRATGLTKQYRVGAHKQPALRLTDLFGHGWGRGSGELFRALEGRWKPVYQEVDGQMVQPAISAATNVGTAERPVQGGKKWCRRLRGRIYHRSFGFSYAGYPRLQNEC